MSQVIKTYVNEDFKTRRLLIDCDDFQSHCVRDIKLETLDNKHFPFRVSFKLYRRKITFLSFFGLCPDSEEFIETCVFRLSAPDEIGWVDEKTCDFVNDDKFSRSCRTSIAYYAFDEYNTARRAQVRAEYIERHKQLMADVISFNETQSNRLD